MPIKKHISSYRNVPTLFRLLVMIIFALVIIFNFCAIWAPYFIDDDADFMVGINDISLSYNTPHLLMGYVHGPFTLYITKLSGVLFGENYFGWRIMQVFATILMIALIFNIIGKIFGPLQAFFALCLSAFNFFFIYNSKYIGEETYFLLFNTAAIAFFLKALKEKKEKYIIITFVFIGLGLLTKITTVWLCFSLVVFVILNRNNLSFVTRKTVLRGSLLCLLLAAPYLFWIMNQSGPLIFSYAHLFGAQSYPNVLSLFIGYFMRPVGPCIDYDLGYNILGPIQGLVGLGGIIYCMTIRKNKYVNFLKVVFLTMLFVSLFIFSGEDAEPRHFSPLIIIAIFAGSILLSAIWRKSRYGKALCVFLVFMLLFETVSYTSHLQAYYYPLHSKLNLSSWGSEEKEVDLNELSKKIIDLCSEFDPTLIVFPSKGLDSTAHFVTAYSGLKTISPLIIDKHLRYHSNDMRRIVVFFTPEDDIEQYTTWAKKNSHTYYYKNDFIDISNCRLFVKILLFSSKLKEIDNNIIEDLKAVVYSL